MNPDFRTAAATVRISTGKHTAEEKMDFAVKVFVNAIKNLLKLNQQSMKKRFILLMIMAHVFTSETYVKSSTSNSDSQTSVGIVIYSNDNETVRIALYLTNYSRNQSDTVSIFLLGKSVELDIIIKKDNDLKEQANKFFDDIGSIK